VQLHANCKAHSRACRPLARHSWYTYLSVCTCAIAGHLIASALHYFRSQETPLAKYLLLRNLKTKAPSIFFALLCQHVHEILPFVYTPTVGAACQKYHKLPLQTWGLYIAYSERGNILQKLQSCSQQNVRVAVVTDGERILGLGDLGTGGMGISEGKIMLYTVAAGACACSPSPCLSVFTGDVQTASSAKDVLMHQCTAVTIDAAVFHAIVQPFAALCVKQDRVSFMQAWTLPGVFQSALMWALTTRSCCKTQITEV
jgi:Malic enzyme, N-terminal domain